MELAEKGTEEGRDGGRKGGSDGCEHDIPHGELLRLGAIASDRRRHGRQE